MGWYYYEMTHRRLWTAAAIIGLFVVVGFVLSVPHTRDAVVAPATPKETVGVPSVTLHDVFKKGLHTITGSVEAPNACATATAEASVGGTASDTQSILVAITLPADTGVCLQLPTRANFSTSVDAPAGLPITATVNGSVATTTRS